MTTTTKAIRTCIDCPNPIASGSKAKSVRCRSCASKVAHINRAFNPVGEGKMLVPNAPKTIARYSTHCETGEPHSWVLPDVSLRQDGHCSRCAEVYPFARLLSGLPDAGIQFYLSERPEFIGQAD